MKKIVSIVAVASAFVAGAALPASAVGTPWSGDDIIIGDEYNFTYWRLNDEGGIGHSGIVHDADANGYYNLSEDLDQDGVLDPSEDLDSDGILDYEDTNGNGELDLAEDANGNGIIDDVADFEFDRVWCGTDGGLRLFGNTIENTVLTGDFDTYGDFVVQGTGAFTDIDGVPGVNLDAKVEYRAYAEGDLLRTVYVLTNNTNAAITVGPSTTESSTDNYGSGTTSSGNSSIEDNDLWWTQYDTEYDGSNWFQDNYYDGTNYYFGNDQEFPSVVFGRYYGSPGLITTDYTDFDPFNGDDEEDVYFSSVTIQPGQSYQWIFFYQVREYAAAAGDANIDTDEADTSVVAAAAAVSDSAADEFGGDLVLSGRLARGLDAGIDANWVIQTQLAETGTDASGIALAGAALVAAGVAVAIRRRRASN